MYSFIVYGIILLCLWGVAYWKYQDMSWENKIKFPFIAYLFPGKKRRLESAYEDGGNFHLINQDYDKAIAYYTEAIHLLKVMQEEKSFGISCVLDGRGKAYAGKGSFAEAMADFNEAIKLTPDYAIWYYSRGKFYYDTGAYSSAVFDLEKAVIMFKTEAEEEGKRGGADDMVKYRLERVEEARKLLDLAKSKSEGEMGVKT